MEDLVIPPADDRRAWCRHVSDGAHGLIHAVEIRRGRDSLVDVVLGAVGRHEDRVERQRAAGRPAGHDVAQSVSGGSRWRVERTLPLRLRDVSRVDDRNVLNVGLSAVSRHPELDVDDADVVIGHVDVVEAEAVELRVGSHPHAVITGDLLRVGVRWAEGGAAVVGLARRDVGQSQAGVRETVVRRRAKARQGRRLLRSDGPVAVASSGGVIGESEEGRRRSIVRHPKSLAAGGNAGRSDDERPSESVRPDAGFRGAAAARQQQIRVERGRRGQRRQEACASDKGRRCGDRARTKGCAQRNAEEDHHDRRKGARSVSAPWHARTSR